MTRWARRAVIALGLVATVACATTTPPRVTPDLSWRQPDVPRELATRAPDVTRYDQAWARAKAGDLAGAEREFTALAAARPPFYPAMASVGELRLHAQRYAEAVVFFEQALAANPRYVPALVGRADAQLGAGDDAGALVALTALVAADPNRAEARTRLDVVRLRVSQTALAAAERARGAGQIAEAERQLARAADATPENSAVPRAWVGVDLAAGRLESAERHARQAIALDAQDGAAWAALADAMSAASRFREASDAWGRALTLEPRAEWRERKTAADMRAADAALPEAFRAIPAATRVTRAQVAAMLGVRLAAVLAKAPARSSEVVTDVRGHWASAWILPVVRVGWMDARPNHTFEPAGVVNRADLARVVAVVLDALPGRGRDAGAVTFQDMPPTHAAFRAAQTAVSAGIMTADANRFQPAAAVSGAELMAVMSRLEARAK